MKCARSTERVFASTNRRDRKDTALQTRMHLATWTSLLVLCVLKTPEPEHIPTCVASNNIITHNSISGSSHRRHNNHTINNSNKISCSSHSSLPKHHHHNNHNA
ncbi:hypothetical protein ElyMa_003936800 [Elysia marginata]|uniref:Uncharacterized protein n=1 Tax=Elysia marginata TaxID=1093978 RepID=A0AAV4FSM9_9GAST|nr:hypothetical protein ElyMa_003936800 [Elysia marginata]